MDTQPELVTQSEYARHRGVSPAAIHKAIEAGRIPEDAVHVQEDGSKLIDAAAADLAMSEGRQRVNATGGESNNAALTRARTFGVVYEARMSQLKYELALGKAVAVEDVQTAAIECAETVLRIIRGASAKSDEIALAAGKEGAAGVRTVLRVLEREQREAIAKAYSDMVIRATAQKAAEQDDGNGDGDQI